MNLNHVEYVTYRKITSFEKTLCIPQTFLDVTFYSCHSMVFISCLFCWSKSNLIAHQGVVGVAIRAFSMIGQGLGFRIAPWHPVVTHFPNPKRSFLPKQWKSFLHIYNPPCLNIRHAFGYLVKKDISAAVRTSRLKCAAVGTMTELNIDIICYSWKTYVKLILTSLQRVFICLIFFRTNPRLSHGLDMRQNLAFCEMCPLGIRV